MHDSSPSNTSGAPEARYVKDTYDAMLPQLPKGYTHFRWQRTGVSRFHYRQTRRALERALRQLPQAVERALEVGGGSGAWTGLFAERSRSLDFVDISAEMIAEAKQALASFKNITYVHSDLFDWKPADGAYELVVSLRNLEYMADKRAALRRYTTALAHGGTLVLSTKNPDFDWFGYFSNKKLHQGQISISALCNLMTEEGVVVQAVYPAITGKKIRHAPVQRFFDGLQWVLLRLPSTISMSWPVRKLTESYLIVARRA